MRYLLVAFFTTIFQWGYSQIDSFPLPPLHFDAQGNLLITASPSSSQNDFDYLLGKWNLKNKHLNSRLTHSHEYTEFEFTVDNTKILEGIGNQDICRRVVNGKAWEGRTIRIFDRQTRLWHLYWMASDGQQMDPPLTGSFDGNIGLFFGKDNWKGTPVIIVFRWDKTNPGQPVWSQAFSADSGKTWEWNFTNTSYRIK